MNTSLLVASMGLIGAGGLAALLASRWPRWASGVAAGATVIGCGMGLVPSIRVLLGSPAEVLRLPWSVPLGDFCVRLDALSAFFLVAIFSLCGVAAIYGAEYLQAYRRHKSLGAPWFFFNVLVAGMVLVVTAQNVVLFLVAMFVLLGGTFGSMDFAGFGVAGQPTAPRASVIFILAVVGFGTKAGFIPFHVWLPEAHPAAPSHVSAIMSGVMIKTGIYGLLRTLTFLGPPPAWWGWLLIAIGLVSGVLGVLFALAQHDLKRLLAYHSVENIGIIALGLGTGMLGLSLHSIPMTVLGFGGGLLHVLNHACFKGLLFLGAGAVLHGTGSREIDRLGGLLKHMPWTGWTFFVGAIAISGLPPLNGFVSELLVYLGALEGVRTASATHLPSLVSVVAGLALIGGLAMACFAKAFGVVFLGEPRSAHASQSHECGWLMRLPMLALATGCAAIGLLGPLVVLALIPVIAQVAGMPTEVVRATIDGPRAVLIAVVGASMLVLLLTAGLMVFRRRLLAGRTVSRTVTWDCGYARPTARMQYTASSFAQPLTWFFQIFLRTRTALPPPLDYFPVSASLATHTDDVCREKVYGPAFRGVGWVLSRLRWLQHGRVQIYVLYIALTLLVLLLWKLE